MNFNFKTPSKLFAWIYSLFCPIYGRKIYKVLLEHLNFGKKERILDFGSGAGILSKKILKKTKDSIQLTCLDTSEAFLNKARKKLKNFINVRFILGDIRNTNLPNDHFDKVFITWVIHHLPLMERQQILRRIVQLLKPDGKIYVIEYVQIPHGIPKDGLDKIFFSFGLISRTIYQKKSTILIEYEKKKG